MKYQQLQPPAFLKDHVRYFWTLESHVAGSADKTFGPIPDGCPGMIFQQSDQGNFYQFEKELPPLFLYGQTTRHTKLVSPGQFISVGVYFYPHALQSVFGLNSDQLTDDCTDLDSMALDQGFRLTEKLFDAPTVEEKIKVLCSYLDMQIKRNNKIADEAAYFAMTRILKSKGIISLKELQDTLFISERNFERRFKQMVGISPKLFARICRFQASLTQLRNNDYDKLSDIAFENEYSDQSHFIRSFKEFTGTSPFQFLKRTTETVQNFPELGAQQVKSEKSEVKG